MQDLIVKLVMTMLVDNLDQINGNSEKQDGYAWPKQHKTSINDPEAVWSNRVFTTGKGTCFNDALCKSVKLMLLHVEIYVT